MKPTLNTLSEAYIILDDLGLAGLLDGGKFELSIQSLLSALLKERKLHAFLSVITGKSEAEVGEYTPSQVLEAITAFFTDMSEDLALLPGFLAQVIPAPNPEPKA
ncbi:MAG: hypothetical protein PHC50_04345 [Candidatus Cloacimonetes bacterium]|nr:hypothetical protein [Candidatus Cloacimonadota bacterium]